MGIPFIPAFDEPKGEEGASGGSPAPTPTTKPAEDGGTPPAGGAAGSPAPQPPSDPLKDPRVQLAIEEAKKIAANDVTKKYTKEIADLNTQVSNFSNMVKEGKMTIEQLTEQKNNLAESMTALESLTLTEKEKFEKEKARKEQEIANTLKTAEQIATQAKEESEKWRKQFTDETMKRSLIEAASKEGATYTEDIVDLLMPKTQLKEVLDSEGKGTGNFVTVVSIKGSDEQGNVVNKEVPVDVAMKELAQTRPLYFSAKGTSGLGSKTTKPPVSTAGKSVGSMTMDEYREFRKTYIQ